MGNRYRRPARRLESFQQGSEPRPHLTRGFPARWPEVEPARLSSGHVLTALGPELGEPAALPGAPVHLDERRFDGDRSRVQQRGGFGRAREGAGQPNPIAHSWLVGQIRGQAPG